MKKRIRSYDILEEVAAGGHATVYRVWDTKTEQVLALKVLHPHLSKDPAYLARFEREATLASSIDHPNVVRIFEVGKAGESHFIAMEFLPFTLDHLLKSEAVVSVPRAVDIARQVACGLQAASQCGVIHRDIKPQNILLDAQGNAKITDFGIARTLDLSTMTRTGLVMGTPQYMAPEQAKGTSPDIRADIYSVGVLLYQMLAGRLPFQGLTPWEIIRQHVEEEPQALGPEVPPGLVRIVQRCLRKEPDERFQTPTELESALMAVQQGLPAPAEDDLAGAMVIAAEGGRGISGPATLPLPDSGGRGLWASPRGRVLAGAALGMVALAIALPATGVVKLPFLSQAAATATPAPAQTGTAVATASPAVTPTSPSDTNVVVVNMDFAGLASGETGTVLMRDTDSKATGVLSVSLTAVGEIPGTVLNISRLLDKPTVVAPSGEAFSFLQFASPAISSTGVSKISVRFQVPNSWLDVHNVLPSAVALYAYDGQWTKLPTTLQGTNAEGVIYQADGTTLGFFAVAGAVPVVATPVPDQLVTQQTIHGTAQALPFSVGSSPWLLRYRTNWTGNIIINAKFGATSANLVQQAVIAGLEYTTYIYGVTGVVQISATAGAVGGGDWTMSVLSNPSNPSPITGLSGYVGTSQANTPTFTAQSSPWLLRYETTWSGPLTLVAMGPKGPVTVFSGLVASGTPYETYVYGVTGDIYFSAKDATADGRWVVRVNPSPTFPIASPPSFVSWAGKGEINSWPFRVDASPWRLTYSTTWTGHLTVEAATPSGSTVIIDREVDEGATYASIVQSVTGLVHFSVTSAPPDSAWVISASRADAPGP